MAKHKAPTQVTIASTEQETALLAVVRSYWPHALAVAVAASLAILYFQWKGEQRSANATESWTSLAEDVPFGSGFGAQLDPPSASTLREVSDQLAGSAAGPWAKALEIGKRLRENDLEGARGALRELEEGWSEHPLVTQPLFPDPEVEDHARTLAQHFQAQVAALEAWKTENADVFQNPPLPADAPKVRFQTSEGSFVIGLYDKLAPEHAKNFLKLCKEGFYDGIKFHRVVRGAMVQGGCPNTRDEEAPETWGQGSNGGTLEPEIGELWHFRNTVSAAATRGGGPTSDCQFFIVTGDEQHEWDREYTVFGMLVEGEDVVAKIENGKVLGERAEEPVVIESTEIL